MKNIYKILTLSARMAMLYFIIIFAITPCLGVSKISSQKTINKKENIEEKTTIDIKEKESRNVPSLSIGPNIGYNITEAVGISINNEDAVKSTGLRRYKVNNYSLGLHIDYNHPILDSYFIGCGYSFLHLPFGKEYNNFSLSLVADKDHINYKNKVNVLFHKKNSQYFTVRAGKFLNDNVSVNINVSMVISEFNMSGAIFTYENIETNLRGNKQLYNFNHFRSDMESKMDFRRVGVAPGIGLTFHLDNKFSAGLNYAYEIYPANRDRSRPRMTTHNFLTKFSYHI
jgi:hypothetical protein